MMKRFLCLCLAMMMLVPGIGLAKGEKNGAADDRESALLAYREYLAHDLSIVHGRSFKVKVSHFYLLDMDGDGVEEMIVYGVADPDTRAFELYDYYGGKLHYVGDSFDICDLSEWRGYSISFEVWDERYLYVYVGKKGSNVDFSEGTLISYESGYCSIQRDDLPLPQKRTVLMDETKAMNGIPMELAYDHIGQVLGSGTAVVPDPQKNSPVKSSARADALRAYASLMKYGMTLYHKRIEATHFYLFDMNADGIEELIVYGIKDYDNRAFEIYTYDEREVRLIGDSYNTCDLSEWGNCNISVSVWDEKYLYVYIGKATVAIDVTCGYLLSYDGYECSCREKNLPAHSTEKRLMTETDIVNGIPIGSAESYLSSMAGEDDSPAQPATEAGAGWRDFNRAMQQTGFLTYEDFENAFLDRYGEPLKLKPAVLFKTIRGSGMTGGAFFARDMEREEYERYGAVGGQKIELVSVLDVLEVCSNQRIDYTDFWPDPAEALWFDGAGSSACFMEFKNSGDADKGYERWNRKLADYPAGFAPNLIREEGRFRFSAAWYGNTVSGDFKCVFKIDNVVIVFEIDDPSSAFYGYLTEGICRYYGVGDESIWDCN